MKTERLEVDGRFGAEYGGIYEFRQVTQGEYETVLLAFLDAFGKIARKDLLKVNRKMMWIALTQQPPQNPLTLERVQNGDIPHGLSTKLQEIYDKANGINPEDQRFLSSQSEEENQTLDLRPSSSAKSSAGRPASTEESTEKQSPSSR